MTKKVIYLISCRKNSGADNTIGRLKCFALIYDRKRKNIANLKKVLDKREELWYNRKAVEQEDNLGQDNQAIEKTLLSKAKQRHKFFEKSWKKDLTKTKNCDIIGKSLFWGDGWCLKSKQWLSGNERVERRIVTTIAQGIIPCQFLKKF